MVRRPFVAGQFYTEDSAALKNEISAIAAAPKEKFNALGAISPHAGYVYSGAVAAEVLYSMEPKSTYVILGPNHTGYGKQFGLDSDRIWKTPLGDVKPDRKLAELILKNSRYIQKDYLCHDYEHSIEVQLPFLQCLNRDFELVPIVISHAEAASYKNIGKELASAIKESKQKVAIIASSDMTHYEPQESARNKDAKAIDRIVALDIDGFLETIERYDISMCGFAPAAIMMQACTELGAKRAKLIRYNTSGDTSGDYSAVVGYAGIVVY